MADAGEDSAPRSPAPSESSASIASMARPSPSGRAAISVGPPSTRAACPLVELLGEDAGFVEPRLPRRARARGRWAADVPPLTPLAAGIRAAPRAPTRPRTRASP